MLKWLAAAVLVISAASAAYAACSNTDGASTGCDLGVTITSVSDLNSRRAQMINMTYAISTGVLPNTMPTVTRGVADPFAGLSWATNPSYPWNVASVDQFSVNLAAPFPSSDGVNPIYLWRAGNPNKNRLVIFNGGHQDTCDWTAMPNHYNMQINMRRLLAAGYSVLGVNQPGPNPNCGNGTGNAMTVAHRAIGAAMGNRTVYPFLEPNNQIINWLEANTPYQDYNMTGISGGGYETDTYAAIDPRIHISIGAASGIPGLQFIPGAYGGDNYVDGDRTTPGLWGEAQVVGYYTIAGYMDQYVMAGYGTTPKGAPRLHQHLLNVYDACCWGDGQWQKTFSPIAGGSYQGYFSAPSGPGAAQCGNVTTCHWTAYLAYYSQQVADKVAALGTGQSLLTMIDWISNYHQISNCDTDSYTVTGAPGTDAGYTQPNTDRCASAGGTRTVGGYPDGIGYIIATLDAYPAVPIGGGRRR